MNEISVRYVLDDGFVRAFAHADLVAAIADADGTRQRFTVSIGLEERMGSEHVLGNVPSAHRVIPAIRCRSCTLDGQCVSRKRELPISIA